MPLWHILCPERQRMQSALFFVHQKECFSVRDFPPEKRRLRSDSVVLLPHTKASASLIPQMPDACEGLYFLVKFSPPSSSFFMERPTRVSLPVFSSHICVLHLSPSSHTLPRRPSALSPQPRTTPFSFLPHFTASALGPRPLALFPIPYSLVPKQKEAPINGCFFCSLYLRIHRLLSVEDAVSDVVG